MIKLDKIYTRGGDSGETSLGDGSRVAKYAIRVSAMGSIDETNASIGVALVHVDDVEIGNILLAIQNDLFDLGADICRPEWGEAGKLDLRIVPGQVAALERHIDSINASLGTLTSFVLPGGSAASSFLHLARTVSRRAERDIAALAATGPVNPEALKYMNRVSDLLFVLARHMNQRGAADRLWMPGLNR